MLFRSLRDFIGYHELTEKDSVGKFTNPTQKVKKKPKSGPGNGPKYQAFWFLKEIKQPKMTPQDLQEMAIEETYAQELFRLYSPSHPKTRLVPDNNGLYTLVRSKDIGPGAICLELYSTEQNNYYFNNNYYKGLGEIIVLSLLLNEGDLKLGNVYVKNRQLIKIDGDMCFWGNYNNKITTNDLARLPHVRDYKAGNWFDIRQRLPKEQLPTSSKDVYEEDKSEFHFSYIFPKSFRENVYFKREVHKTILEVLLTPTGIFRQVLHDVLLNVPNSGAKKRDLASIIDDRKQQLFFAAMNLPDFKAFLQSYDARTVKTEFINKLKAHRTRAKRKLHIELYEEDINKEFAKLVPTPAASPKKRKAADLGLFSQPAEQPAEKKGMLEQLSEYFFGY